MHIDGLSLPWRERVRVRGNKIWHPHLCPLPSRERMFQASLLVNLALTLLSSAPSSDASRCHCQDPRECRIRANSLLFSGLRSHEISHLVTQGLHLGLQLRGFSQLIWRQYATNF